MQDLILDQILGKKLIEISEDTKQLRLKFTEGTLLCFHDQECCESFVYLGKKSNKLGVIANTNLKITRKLDKRDWRNLNKFSKNINLASYLELNEIHTGSYTVTILNLYFLDGTSNVFKFLGVSNGNYRENIQFEWTNY